MKKMNKKYLIAGGVVVTGIISLIVLALALVKLKPDEDVSDMFDDPDEEGDESSEMDTVVSL